MKRFGIEYTFRPKTGSNSSYRRGLIADRLAEKGFPRAYVDPDCVEVPSPPHSSLEEAKRFFDRLGKAVGMENLTPCLITTRNGIDTYHGTGGGHIHVELPLNRAVKTGTLRHLVHIMANRPWLNWVFNEFKDDHTANALLDESGVLEYLKRDGFSHNCLYEGLTGILCERDRNIRVNNDNETIEFRIFDAPKNWQQTKDHVEMAVRIVEWAEKLAKADKKPEKVIIPDFTFVGNDRFEIDFKRQYKSRSDVEKPFKALVKVLGLDWKRYRKYLGNFTDRVKYGRLV